MALLQELIGAGTPPLQTQGIMGSVANGLTATGTTNADALQLGNAINRVTTTAIGTGVKLPIPNPGESVLVVNSGANALLVYPGTGVQINALTATTGGFSVAAGGRALFVGVTNAFWFAVLSA
jgi:hypothetical protein